MTICFTCGRPQPSGRPQAGKCSVPGCPGTTNLGEFVAEQILGHGGFGVVFKASSTRRPGFYAVKVCSPYTTGGTSFSANAQTLEIAKNYFSNEEWVLRKLAERGLTGISKVVAFQRSDALTALVLEFIEGTTLTGYDGVTSDADAALVACRVLETVAQIHDCGLVLRDLKSDNVMITPGPGEPIVTLIDFGTAAMKEFAKENGTRILTERWAAPEQMAGVATERSDIYQVGMMVAQMATGLAVDAFYPPGSVYHRLDAVPELRKSKLRDFVLKATQRKPEQRYQSARDALSALRATGLLKRTPAARPVTPKRAKGSRPAPAGSAGRGAGYVVRQVVTWSVVVYLWATIGIPFTRGFIRGFSEGLPQEQSSPSGDGFFLPE